MATVTRRSISGPIRFLVSIQVSGNNVTSYNIPSASNSQGAKIEWGTIATVAVSVLTGVAVPFAGWLLSQLEALRERVTRLEERQQNLDNNVAKALERLDKGFEKLSEKLEDHMKNETLEIESILRRIMEQR